MGFGKIFQQSIKDYKLNIKTILGIVLIFFFVPFILLLALNYGYSSSETGKAIVAESKTIQTQLNNFDLSGGTLSEEDKAIVADLNSKQLQLLIKQAPYLGLSFVLFIISLFIGYFGMLGIMVASFKPKFTYSDSVKGAKRFYWRSIGLMILLFVFFLLIALAGGILIAIGVALASISNIVGIIFVLLVALIFFGFFIWISVDLTFSNFILVNENKSIFASLSGSFKLLKEKWWVTFGRFILFALCAFVLFVLMFLIFYLVGGIFNGVNSQTSMESLKGFIWNLISYFVLFPIYILFIKNLYLNLKKNK